jgi:hypothetical protein
MKKGTGAASPEEIPPAVANDERESSPRIKAGASAPGEEYPGKIAS